MPQDEFDDWDKVDLDVEEDEEQEQDEELDDMDDLEEDGEDVEDEDEKNSPAILHGEKVGLRSEAEEWEIVDPDDEVEAEDSLTLDEEQDLKDKSGIAYGKDKRERPQKSKRRASVIRREKMPGHSTKRTKRPGTAKSKNGSRRK